MFKNILRKFEAEVFKIFLKEHSSSAQKLGILIKMSYNNTLFNIHWDLGRKTFTYLVLLAGVVWKSEV